MPIPTDFTLTCPIPFSEYPNVLLAHGSGGRLMHQLIERIFFAAFGDPDPATRHDSALLDPGGGRLAFTTDSYVVWPLIFPGGDIGSLAVHGTVNDLAMSGAKPLALSAGFILEEGLPLETLWRIVLSMQVTAEAAGVRIVTGDTKVVDRGKGDGVYINTTGIGKVVSERPINAARVQPGDRILVSGDLGRHGIAILSAREGLAFETDLTSDCASLWEPVRTLLDAGVDVHCLRDLTRGGLASALNEIAATAKVGMTLEEAAVPVGREVRAACEILGFDPLYVACEGRFAAFVSAEEAPRALELLRSCEVSAGASICGTVTATSPGQVVLRSTLGTGRIVEMLSGDQLPRIC